MEILKTLKTVYDFINPILDALILAFIFYKCYQILVKTQAVQLLKGALSLALIYGLAFLFRLNTLTWLLNIIAPGIVMGIAIIFQPELRRIFMRIGQGEWIRIGVRTKHSHVDSALTAAEILSENRRGMLVVFIRRSGLKDIIETGTKLNAELSSSLLVTIFGHDTPLHDGAVIVHGGKIIAAGCFLPLSEQQDIRKTFGTRHRAALGTSEISDAIIMIVSEETGAISLAYDSKIYYDLTSAEILRQMDQLLETSQDFSPAREGAYND